MNAAGVLGFAPDLNDTDGWVDWARLGAFVTNPISLGPRAPAHGMRYAAYPGGFLLHTGFPNPGVRAVLQHYAPQWARSPLPVLVHLLVHGEADALELLRRLEEVPGVSGFELGLPSEVGVQEAVALVQALQSEQPLIVRLPLDRAVELGLALSAAAPGAFFSLGPPRGALANSSGGLTHGRLYGPGLFPLALEATRTLALAGLAVIAAGGVYQPEQAEIMLAAGAMAVQLDAVLWRSGWNL